jgi:hypothetical protein
MESYSGTHIHIHICGYKGFGSNGVLVTVDAGFDEVAQGTAMLLNCIAIYLIRHNNSL